MRQKPRRLNSLPFGPLAVVSCALWCASPACAESWNTYANARYAYSICYPSTLMTPQPEADDGDGRSFLGMNGEKLIVWGIFNVLNLSPAAALQSLKPDVIGPHSVTTYQNKKADSVILSGLDGSNIFYARALTTDNGVLDTFLLVYPKAEANIFDAVAARIAGCFKASS